MPMLKKILAGVALSTALAGGALAVGVTAASADTTPKSHETEKTHEHDHQNDNKWWEDKQNCWWQDKNNFQNNCFWKNNKDDHTNFGLAVKDIAIGFQDKTNKDDFWNNQNWHQKNDCWNFNDKDCWNNHDKDNDDHDESSHESEPENVN